MTDAQYSCADMWICEIFYDDGFEGTETRAGHIFYASSFSKEQGEQVGKMKRTSSLGFVQGSQDGKFTPQDIHPWGLDTQVTSTSEALV